MEGGEGEDCVCWRRGWLWGGVRVYAGVGVKLLDARCFGGCEGCCGLW